MRGVQNKPPAHEKLITDLPADRASPGDPLEVSGVEHTGPLSVKYMDRDGGTILVAKMWSLCLFARRSGQYIWSL